MKDSSICKDLKFASILLIVVENLFIFFFFLFVFILVL